MNKIIKIIIVLLIAVFAAVAAFNVNLNIQKKSSLSALALANVEALARDEGGLDTSYNRNPFLCTIYGNGKIKMLNGTIFEIKGSLSFDGGMFCTSGGSATCTNVECSDLWEAIFNNIKGYFVHKKYPFLKFY